MRDQLVDRFASVGLPLTSVQADQFVEYGRLLLEWNQKMNLTRITQWEQVIDYHFIDSLSPMMYGLIPQCASLIDVGTGAGFPGLPMAIYRTNVCVLLLDSLKKRVTFLSSIISCLGLPNVSTIHARAEELSRAEEYREKYDIATARAVSSVAVLAEYLLPYVRVGGSAIAFKTDLSTELDEARAILGALGGKVNRTIDVSVPRIEWNHKLLLLDKIRMTPSKFPRQSAQITK